ncbi:ribonuclease H family protein [Bifidobacterium pongonis]|uniref:ribonuclease H family protein n=1 Tax=Bifidobacterium pongonis TaxID=2834432 RepID=UPI003B837D60
MGWAWADHARNAGGTPGHRHDDRGYDHGGATNGTNQIGELCAVLEALRAHPGAEPLLIESDSQYAINCSTKWVKGWKKNGWKNSQKKPVKNAELIKAIDAEIAKREGPVDFRWVKGHAGNAGNELVDELARGYATDCRSGAKDGYLPIEGWQSLLHSEYSAGTDVPPDVQLVLDGKASADSLRPVFEMDGDEQADADHDAKRPEEHQPEPSVKQPVKQSADNEHAESRTTSRTATQAAQPTPQQPAPQQHAPQQHAQPTQQAAPQHIGRPSGLNVSGDLTFSPAPKTSPYFTGEPMPVHGYIEIDGYVDGDGNLHITNTPFMRR